MLLLVILCAMPGLAAGPEGWFLLPEPKFMRHGVSFPIEGAKGTVLAPARMGDFGIEFATAAGWAAAGLDQDAVRKVTQTFASEWFKHVKPELVRNRKGVVEYAAVRSEKLPVSATVFAPEFWKHFESVFGPKMMVVIPNRQTVFVFPGLAVNLTDFAPIVIEAWRGPVAKCSLEVFELSERGFRAVGKFDDP